MSLKKIRKNCTLLITHNCNLNCTYCYEKHKDVGTMTFKMAKEIIEQEFYITSQCHQFDEIEIDFLGGEPFLEFNLMKKIMEWTWSVSRPIPYFFSTSTNGTLLTKEMKDWCRIHKNKFKVVLSCDGMLNSQNINRSQCNNQIDYDFFLNVYPEQTLKMTISPQCVHLLAQEVIALQEKGFLVAPSYAHGVVWSSDAIKEYKKQLLVLAKYFLNKENQEDIPQFQKRLSAIFSNDPIKRFCGCGSAMATYDIDGNAYHCHLFSPFVMGEKFRNINIDNEDALQDARCQNCCYVRLCKTCYGFNFKEQNDPCIRSATNCMISQVEIEACIYYKMHKLHKKQQQGIPLSVDELYEAKAILLLNDIPPEEKRKNMIATYRDIPPSEDILTI